MVLKCALQNIKLIFYSIFPFQKKVFICFDLTHPLHETTDFILNPSDQVML